MACARLGLAARGEGRPNEHMKAVGDGIARLYQRRHAIRFLRFVHEPPTLRFFQGRFEPIA